MTTDSDLIPQVAAAVHAAAEHLRDEFDATPPPISREDVISRIRECDARSLSILRPLLEAAHPAGWVEDELEDGPLPPGDWWVIDPVEGAINYVHGIADWAVTATLVRDNTPVLTVVELPLEVSTYTAVRGEGAYRNGLPLRVSAKTQLNASLVGSGQASPRETADTFQLIARTLPAMMGASGVTRLSVPPTLQLVQVAAGRMDVFWQHSAVRSGLLAGALLVEEAGGVVSDLRGQPWALSSTDFLAAAPGVHREAVSTLVSALR